MRQQTYIKNGECDDDIYYIRHGFLDTRYYMTFGSSFYFVISSLVRYRVSDLTVYLVCFAGQCFTVCVYDAFSNSISDVFGTSFRFVVFDMIFTLSAGYYCSLWEARGDAKRILH